MSNVKQFTEEELAEYDKWVVDKSLLLMSRKASNLIKIHLLLEAYQYLRQENRQLKLAVASQEASYKEEINDLQDKIGMLVSYVKTKFGVEIAIWKGVEE